MSQIPAGELGQLSGARTNRTTSERNLTKGFHSLPYFSAHCLSEIDPTLDAKPARLGGGSAFVVLSRGLLVPHAVSRSPWLSQRAPGYADYVLGAVNLEIDKLA